MEPSQQRTLAAALNKSTPFPSRHYITSTRRLFTAYGTTRGGGMACLPAHGVRDLLRAPRAAPGRQPAWSARGGRRRPWLPSAPALGRVAPGRAQLPLATATGRRGLRPVPNFEGSEARSCRGPGGTLMQMQWRASRPAGRTRVPARKRETPAPSRAAGGSLLPLVCRSAAYRPRSLPAAADPRSCLPFLILIVRGGASRACVFGRWWNAAALEAGFRGLRTTRVACIRWNQEQW
jgi:hypothetical protein